MQQKNRQTHTFFWARSEEIEAWFLTLFPLESEGMRVFNMKGTRMSWTFKVIFINQVWLGTLGFRRSNNYRILVANNFESDFSLGTTRKKNWLWCELSSEQFSVWGIFDWNKNIWAQSLLSWNLKTWEPHAKAINYFSPLLFFFEVEVGHFFFLKGIS